MMDKLHIVLTMFGIEPESCEVSSFCAEEDGSPYRTWRIVFKETQAVLKQVSEAEREVYESFFSNDCRGVPAVFGFRELSGECYMLIEYIEGKTMSRCTRSGLKQTLDALIAIQQLYWNNSTLDNVGYCFAKCFPNREKRLSFMEDLQGAYQAYLDCFQTVPRTLCNDDLLPFNVIVNDSRAVIIDWEYAGILPYPCAFARLIAFGEDAPDAMFYMTQEDREFAVQYYYDNLIAHKGIAWEDYIHTLKLFLFKEYSEWVYCANSSNQYDMPHYKKYYTMAKALAAEMGLYAGNA